MLAMVGARGFALAAERANGGVYCGAEGVFVGNVPLLKRDGMAGAWSACPIAELNHELTDHYRLPVDIAVKANSLALIAHALNRGDLAMAAIATVQMQLPDPPIANTAETYGEVTTRAAELDRCGLLKFWDPLKHPRLGGPPNSGWFAPTDGSDGQASPDQTAPQLAELPDEWLITPCPVSMVPGPGGCEGFGGPSRSTEGDFVGTRTRGGRLGNAATRAQNAELAAQLEARGFTVIYGGGSRSEEYIAGEGPGTLGGTYVDITATNSKTGATIRVQTVDTLADGTPTPREEDAAARIRKKFPNDTLFLIPKRITR